MGKTLLGCGFVLLSLAAVACGGSSGSDDDDDDGGGGGAIPIESLPTRLASTICKLAYQCCSSEQRGENIFIGSTEAECRSNYGAFLALATPEWNQSITKKRMRYDGNGAATCLSRIEAAGCSGGEDPAACDGVFIPLVQSGGACTQQGECIDSACIGGDSTNDIDGLCGSPLANGADCTDDGECASGYCSGVSCEAQVANGTACSIDSECVSDFCDSDGVCADETSSVCD
jgi:hypothetical protein